MCSVVRRVACCLPLFVRAKHYYKHVIRCRSLFASCIYSCFYNVCLIAYLILNIALIVCIFCESCVASYIECHALNNMFVCCVYYLHIHRGSRLFVLLVNRIARFCAITALWPQFPHHSFHVSCVMCRVVYMV